MFMNTNNQLQSIAGFAHNHMEEAYRQRPDRVRLDQILSHAGYRWEHTQRVAQYGKVIAETDGANVELVVAGCLLHDIAWFDTNSENSRDHGRIGSKIARPFLEGLGYSPNHVENICYSIATHVDEELPTTIEARIVSDADNVDRFGPYRILQWCYSDISNYDRLADKLQERIQRLEQYREKNMMFTPTGRQLFAEQLDLQIKFLSAFVGEKKLTILPNF
jgi:putative nucleotidyltransferase with HDIG domain